jgi:hypothetical protein
VHSISGDIQCSAPYSIALQCSMFFYNLIQTEVINRKSKCSLIKGWLSDCLFVYSVYGEDFLTGTDFTLRRKMTISIRTEHSKLHLVQRTLYGCILQCNGKQRPLLRLRYKLRVSDAAVLTGAFKSYTRPKATWREPTSARKQNTLSEYLLLVPSTSRPSLFAWQQCWR